MFSKNKKQKFKWANFLPFNVCVTPRGYKIKQQAWTNVAAVPRSVFDWTETRFCLVPVALTPLSFLASSTWEGRNRGYPNWAVSRGATFLFVIYSHTFGSRGFMTVLICSQPWQKQGKPETLSQRTFSVRNTFSTMPSVRVYSCCHYFLYASFMF